MKRIYTSLFILSVILVLSACGETTSSNNKLEVSSQLSKNVMKEIAPFFGNWKYEIHDRASKREQQLIE